ncbi:cytochrome c oxidase assembly protein [Haliea atlantica]|jgi:cytochrome c oxidase assembly protein subunit 11|nr:cytochrome c oxidase assembly protein [Haliea sp.]MAL95039.1 cytochrome c oxidase assembly protein [Haliea sp.]|tara:strand:- start:2992 stop:3552 length:561 start_codon:yes stop_codon:yes gene_type:complete
MLKVSRNPVVDTVAKLVVTAVAMFAFVFVVMVPLYNVLCDALGINGKTSGEAYTSVQAGVDETRMVTIQFVATNNEGMPWEFGPSVNSMKVHPGASNDTVFHASNPLPDAMVAQAIPSISPSRAAAYFHKTECFCFNQQPLDGESSAEMPLQFIVDRDLPQDIHTITLSYTIFDVTDMVRGAVAAR